MQPQVRRGGADDDQRAPAGADDPHAAPAVRQGEREPDETDERRADSAVDRLRELFESGRKERGKKVIMRRMRGAASRSMCWSRWCITTGITRIAVITHVTCKQVGRFASFGVDGAWYLANDQHVEPISCPYVDCAALGAL